MVAIAGLPDERRDTGNPLLRLLTSLVDSSLFPIALTKLPNISLNSLLNDALNSVFQRRL